MSKSAIKALANADAMIKAAGVNNAAPLVEYLNDGKSRTAANGKKLWRNADVLASLLISAVASCFQCETPDTFAENHFDDMAQAIDRYVASALDSWSQVEWATCRNVGTRGELDHLANMINNHIEYMRRRELVQPLEKQIGANNRELVTLDTGSNKSKELAVINIALREMIRRINGESPDFRIMPSADVVPADEATAKICTSCADYLDNDNLDAFGDGHDDLLQIAAASLRAWSYGWQIIGTDKNNIDQDVSFNCECCKQRIHGQRFTLILSEGK
ncbi:hypothetical protein pEpSNUABM08_75 [Erwinia phage pEp_SNUABM_08]|uniref:Uncharacterized protein n=1 Tax=Erwinia phage pEp_SNUABM_08 TaxID=2593268 RepID=A0A5J6DAC0_9CAUD|nr:hypothetical protein JT353_gp75 [Erwinia phage pEp_SNUABM_08]QEQ94822.1 hypothetical protein pEpSNUABM08_75 [Erwinia phage pEp_SNUABM_08]HED5782852.1 hypothetical protein [Enterobacter hormaechei]HED5802414.1 hypothetical protein [Enterobacter hormaechei]HED5821841.1 hypothetical protein [Enterobacter hormaechei]